MPDSCRQQVLAAVAAALAAIDIDGLTVTRDRENAVTDADLAAGPVLVLFDGETARDDILTGEDGFLVEATVEGYASGATMAAADAALEQLRGKVLQAVHGNAALRALARSIEDSLEPPPERLGLEAARPTKGFSHSFELGFATREGDPFTFV